MGEGRRGERRRRGSRARVGDRDGRGGEDAEPARPPARSPPGPRVGTHTEGRGQAARERRGGVRPPLPEPPPPPPLGLALAAARASGSSLSFVSQASQGPPAALSRSGPAPRTAQLDDVTRKPTSSTRPSTGPGEDLSGSGSPHPSTWAVPGACAAELVGEKCKSKSEWLVIFSFGSGVEKQI